MITWEDVQELAEQERPEPDRRVEKSDQQWKQILTEKQYQITRHGETESPWSGEYCEAHQPGLYTCVCCGTELFDSRTKFKSGSGWPSFTKPVKNNVVRYEKDVSLGMTRIEVLCNVCDAHLGHVFPDGPKPSGLRFCINSAALERVEHEQNREQ